MHEEIEQQIFVWIKWHAGAGPISFKKIQTVNNK